MSTLTRTNRPSSQMDKSLESGSWLRRKLPILSTTPKILCSLKQIPPDNNNTATMYYICVEFGDSISTSSDHSSDICPTTETKDSNICNRKNYTSVSTY